ncbi:MAG: aldo/keto reductase [Coriobacteriales bacterium]|jgi:predicted aldo/keto reductase-like oxidoreductase|nr:aldo/keto reductase [Coriobacteriales bacterium]
MGYLGQEIPKLGFGLMRLPRIVGTQTAGVFGGGEIDIEQTKQMVDAFMEAGFTYFDTARGYEGSEAAIKEALVDRYPRASYQLATKLPAWAGAKNASEARKMFETSLETTGAGYFDYYLLHNMGAKRTQVFDDFGMWDYVVDLKKRGLVKHIGLSLHDTAEHLDEILTAHPEMEFVQLQINYAYWEDSSIQGRACYEVARKHKKPIIIMEPVRGGGLANPPQPVADILTAANPNASFVSWALRFCLGLEDIITVLSGMSTLEQVQQNIEVCRDFEPLTSAELEVIDQAQRALAAIPTVPCTACKYCLKQCPQNIEIDNVMQALNRGTLYGQSDGKSCYWFATLLSSKASTCIECGTCEEACPQSIKIIDELKRAVELYEE